MPADRPTPAPIDLGPIRLTFETPIIMGILNVTPDSFSDGGQLPSVEAAIDRARELVAAGATLLDIGGESTRPGANSVDAATEIARVTPVLERIAALQLPAALSIDTAKAAVAAAALQSGATVVNDVSALRDPEMAAVVADGNAALILMHMRGEPRTMQQGEIHYDDVIGEVRRFLAEAVDAAVGAGVTRHRILVDPGIGFGKTLAHNLALTRHLPELANLGQPLVYGPSRKRFLGAITTREVGDRDRATAAACALAVSAGAHVLRVHDVAAVSDAVAVATAVRDAP